MQARTLDTAKISPASRFSWRIGTVSGVRLAYVGFFVSLAIVGSLVYFFRDHWPQIYTIPCLLAIAAMAVPFQFLGAALGERGRQIDQKRLAVLGDEVRTMLRENWMRPLDPARVEIDASLLGPINGLIEHTQQRESIYSDYMITNCVLVNEIKKNQSALDATTVGVIGVDSQGVVFFHNRAAQPFLKKRVEGWLGAPAAEALRDADVLRLLEASQESGNQTTVGIELPPDPDTHRGFTGVTRTSFISENDEVTGVAFAFVDIDRQKNLEVTQVEFLDNVAHEFRTPLTSILASIEMLQQNMLPDQSMRDRFYNIIHEETYRLSALIDNLLNISMMERGSLGLNIQPTRLKKFIEEVIDVIRPQCQQKNIELIVELPDRLPTFNIDKSLFNIALLNVVGNAVKYTPAGGRILFETSGKEDSIHLIVQDTGMGISEEHQQRIFEKFYRVPQEGGAQEIKGNGIGLAFSRQIVRMHGGDIKVQSKKDEGSRFILSLPRTLINKAIGE